MIVFRRRARWPWVVGLALLAGSGGRPAQAGPLKRYVGQPVAAPEAADPLTQGTLQGADRGLDGRHWPSAGDRRQPETARSRPGFLPSVAASAPTLDMVTPVPPEQADRYAGGIVLGLLTTSLALLGLLALRHHRRRTLANSLVRYALTHGHADLRAN